MFFLKRGERFFEAVTILTGTVIGAGILGIPYVVARAGFYTGILVILGIGFAILMMNLFLGEIILSTKGKHQLTGYAEKYLGKVGKTLMCVAMFFGIYGALIAYLIGEGRALFEITGMFTPVFWSFMFFALMAALVFSGVKTIGKSEFILFIGIFIIVILISVSTFPHVNASNLVGFDLKKMLLPYGAILFAYIGTAAIPEMSEILKKRKKWFKDAIVIGSVIPLGVYILFTFVVVGVNGLSTTEVASIGLGKAIGYHMIVFGNVFAIFLMATSFLTLALALMEMYNYDYGINKGVSWFLACFIPLFIFLGGVTSFIKTITIAGAVAGGIDGILIVLMFHKVKKMGEREPEYTVKPRMWLSFLLVLMFVVGIIYAFLSTFGIL